MALAACQSAAGAGDPDDLVDDRPVSAPNRLAVGAEDPLYYARRWGFGGEREGRRFELESLLKKNVAESARAGALSDGQRQKLLLAGTGDIHHLFDRMEQIKSKYQSEALDQDGLRRLNEETRPLLIGLFKGPFGENSLFAKTRAKILTPEQVVRIERDDDNRRSFQHRASVRMAVLRLSTALG